MDLVAKIRGLLAFLWMAQVLLGGTFEAQENPPLTSKDFRRLHSFDGLTPKNSPSVLIVIPKSYNPKVFDAVYPLLQPRLQEKLQSIQNLDLKPKNRSKSWRIISDALNAPADNSRSIRDLFLEATNAISAPAEIRQQRDIKDWKEIINLWESYSLDANLRFKIRPNFSLGALEFPEIQDPENSKSENPVELKGKLQFWGNPIFETQAFNLSLTSDATREQFRVLEKPGDLLRPDVSTITLPETYFELNASLLDYSKQAASTPENPRPFRIRFDGLKSNLDSVQIPEDRAEAIVRALFTKEHIDEGIDVALGTKAFEETRKTLEADLEYQIQRQSMPVIVWIERTGPHKNKFHFGIKNPEIESEIKKLEDQGALYTKAESEIKFKDVSDVKLLLSRAKGLEVTAQAPEKMTFSFKPGVLHPSDQLLNEIKDPTVRMIVERILSEAPKEDPDLRVDIRVKLADRNAEFKLPIQWKDGSYEFDTEKAQILLPLMGKARIQSITVVSGKKDVPPFTLWISTGERAFNQIINHSADFMKVARALVGDEGFSDTEKRIQSEITKHVRALGDEKPLEIKNEKTSLTIKVKSFNFATDHELHCDWFHEAKPSTGLEFKRSSFGYRQIEAVLPDAYQRLYGLDGSYEISCTMDLPKEMGVRLENIKSDKADIKQVDMNLRFNDAFTTTPQVRLKLKVVRDTQTGRPVLVPVENNIAEIVSGYHIGTGPSDFIPFGIEAHGLIARAAEGAANSMMGARATGDIEGDMYSMLSQVLGLGLKAYVGKEKVSQSSDEIRKEFEKNKSYIYESITREVFEAMNGTLPPSLLDRQFYSDNNKGRIRPQRGEKDPPIDFKNIGVLGDIREGFADFVNEIIASVPTGPEVQNKVETEVRELIGNSIESREGGVKSFPKQFTNEQMRALLPSLKRTVKSLVINAISGNSKEWNSAVQEAITKPDADSDDPESIIGGAERDLNRDFFTVLDPRLINAELKPNTAASENAKDVKLPDVKQVCIYPTLYEKNSAEDLQQNFRAVGLFMRAREKEAPTTLSAEPPRGLPLEECKGRFCSATTPQVMISTDLVEELLNSNMKKLAEVVQQSITYEKEESKTKAAAPADPRWNTNDQVEELGPQSPEIEAKRSKRFGIHDSAKWEFSQSQGFEMEVGANGTAAVKFGFKFTQDGIFSDIDTGNITARLEFTTRIINRLDAAGKITGYDLEIKGRKIELTGRPGFRLNFTNFFLDAVEEEAAKFLTRVPLDHPVMIPGMKFKLGELSLVKGANGHDAIVTSMVGQPFTPCPPKRIEVKMGQKNAPSLQARNGLEPDPEELCGQDLPRP